MVLLLYHGGCGRTPACLCGRPFPT